MVDMTSSKLFNALNPPEFINALELSKSINAIDPD